MTRRIGIGVGYSNQGRKWMAKGESISVVTISSADHVDSVVLRQMWLMGNEPPPEGEPSDPLSIQERAYDKARKEFYDVRQRQDIERQVAKEEAIHYGAYFDVGEIERSLKEEDKQFAAWKEFAKKDVEMAAHQQAGAYRGNNPSEIAEAIAVSSEAEAEQVIEEEADSAVAVPA